MGPPRAKPHTSNEKQPIASRQHHRPYRHLWSLNLTVQSTECGQVGRRPESLSVGDLMSEHAIITLEMESHNNQRTVTITRKQEIFFDWMSDVVV